MMCLALLFFEERTTFIGLVKILTFHSLIKINKMSVKLRSVHTCKLNFISDDQSAGSAHSGSVDHDRVHRYDRRNTEFLREKTYELHHDHRADRDTHVIFIALIFHKVFDDLGYHTFSLIRSVIRGDIEITRNSLHFVFKNHEILGLRTDDDIGIYTVFMKPFDLGINRCGPETSAEVDDIPVESSEQPIREVLGALWRVLPEGIRVRRTLEGDGVISVVATEEIMLPEYMEELRTVHETMVEGGEYRV